MNTTKQQSATIVKDINLNTITYKEFKDISQEKFNTIPLYYFFNSEQKREVLKKLDIKECELSDKVFGFQGGIILKSQAHQIEDFYNWIKKAEQTLYQRKDYLYQLFYYELFNHEVQITCDYEGFLKNIGMELDTDLKKQAFEKAKKKHWNYCLKHDYF